MLPVAIPYCLKYRLEGLVVIVKGIALETLRVAALGSDGPDILLQGG